MSVSNLSEFWKLAGAGAAVPAASLGVTDIVRRRSTLRTETCTLHREGAPFDGEPPFAPGSTVTVWRDGVPWFVGRVTATPGSADGQGEALDVVLSGPWWFLENLVYRQDWALGDGAGIAALSRVVLGQGEDGGRLTSGQTVAAVLRYAIDAGAPFQIGTMEPSVTLPLDELRNVTCAHAIRRVLRWLPDCVGWFDHATLPVPTFHCRARLGLPTVALTVGQAPLAAVRGISARPDLLTPAVALHYERWTEDGLEVLTDAAPGEATGREFGAWVATIPAERPARKTQEAAPAASFEKLDQLPVRGETPGESLAQALYGARAALPYSGSVVLAQAEAGGAADPGLGTTLNLLGTAQAAWATMRALVIEDETRAGNGETTVRLGVPEGAEAAATAQAEAAEAGLAGALLPVQPGVVGRETGSPAVL